MKSYNVLVDELISNRLARVSSSGTKYDSEICKLCVETSMS